jgi:Flp pilus assembly protein TadD
MSMAADLAARAAAGLPEARALNLLGVAQARLGRTPAARRTFLEALERDPTHVETYVNLGLLELEVADLRASAVRFTEALAIDPNSHAAREGLALSLERAGRRDRAMRIRLSSGGTQRMQ